MTVDFMVHKCRLIQMLKQHTTTDRFSMGATNINASLVTSRSNEYKQIVQPYAFVCKYCYYPFYVYALAVI